VGDQDADPDERSQINGVPQPLLDRIREYGLALSFLNVAQKAPKSAYAIAETATHANHLGGDVYQ